MHLEVFTTLRILNGKLLFLNEHLKRLQNHAHLACIAVPDIKLPKNLPNNCLLRIAINNTGCHFSSRPFQEPPQKEVCVYISDQNAHTQLKTTERCVYDEALRQAKEQGAFEGLLLNKDGYLVDGSRSSLFMIYENTFTIFEGGIEGITRQQEILKAQKQGLHIQRAFIKPHEIRGQLYIAGTGLGTVKAYLARSV